jgi:hypothetical protein
VTRALRPAVLSLALALVAGCWQWSFPELKRDGARSDAARLDQWSDRRDMQRIDRPPACYSDKDCGSKVCNLATGRCVSCLESPHCKDLQRPVCDPQKLECVGCLADNHCNTAGKKVCDPEKLECVACVKASDCPDPTRAVCAERRCVGCLSKEDCKFDKSKPFCDTASKLCVGCLQPTDCPSGKCTDNTCAGCTGNDKCPTGLVCDPKDQTCVRRTAPHPRSSATRRREPASPASRRRTAPHPRPSATS